MESKEALQRLRPHSPELVALRAEFDSQLKKCPFCGEKAAVKPSNMAYYSIECTECYGENHGKYIGEGETVEMHRKAIEDAVEAWNTRPKK